MQAPGPFSWWSMTWDPKEDSKDKYKAAEPWDSLGLITKVFSSLELKVSICAFLLLLSPWAFLGLGPRWVLLFFFPGFHPGFLLCSFSSFLVFYVLAFLGSV